MGLNTFVRALYIHLPFCAKRCRYCDFATCAVAHGDPLVAAYVDAMRRLVAHLGAAGTLSGVVTAYVGGGTPTMAGEGLAHLVADMRAAAPEITELTCEANPESLDARTAAQLADDGATRVSLGVQSLDDAELARLGRIHTAASALRAAHEVRASGLALSCDLMCGIPLQTPGSWERSLAGVLDAGATHVSCYPLIIEDGTPLARAIDEGREQGPDDDLQADLMLAAERALGDAGLARYEVASYAAPGRECAHNVAYWTGVPYLGLGPGASGMVDRAGLVALAGAMPLAVFDEGALAGGADAHARLARPPRDLSSCDAAAYLREHACAARLRIRMLGDARSFVEAVAARTPLPVAIEGLTAREAAAEDLMLGMRMTRGVGKGLLAHAAASGIARDALERTLADLQARGLAHPTDGGGWAPTETGWLLGNELHGALWDLAE